MTIKTSEGTVTAPANILNVLSFGYSAMADSYEKDKLNFLAEQFRTISHEIFLALSKAGFYSSSRSLYEEEEESGESESKSRESESGNGLKVRRNILMDDVRFMCIRYGFYTKGNCKDYDSMLSSCNGYVSDDVLEQTAIDIVEHSSEDSLKAAFDVPFDSDSMSCYITCMVEMLVNCYSRTVAFY